MDSMSRGITLIELLVVAVVLGVLAILGIPTYRATIERGYCREARDLLLAIYTGERLYYSKNGSYRTFPGNNWQDINLDNPNSPASPMVFAVGTSCGVDCFLASAAHSVSGETWLTVNQDRAFVSPSGRCP